MNPLKSVALIAPTGMLGSMVYNILKDEYRLTLVYRSEHRLEALNQRYGDVGRHRAVKYDFADLYDEYVAGNPQEAGESLVREVGQVDAVINCAGIVIPHMLRSPVQTFFINGALPHILSWQYGSKLIHVTTDCVFSGRAGTPYDEDSPKSPRDIYGLSKSLGEPFDRSLVLRTSIIGPELTGCASLLEWLRSRQGTSVDGYTNHLWNGVTTKSLALAFSRIVDRRDDYAAAGLFHVFATDTSKYELLEKLKDKYGLDVTITPRQVEPIDRRLSTTKKLNDQLQMPALDVMIGDL